MCDQVTSKINRDLGILEIIQLKVWNTSSRFTALKSAYIDIYLLER